MHAPFKIEESSRQCDFHFFPELKGEYGWRKHNFAWEFDVSLHPVVQKDSVQRVDVRQISQDEFVEKFDIPKLPVVLTHVQDHWMAKKKWTKEVNMKLFLIFILNVCMC